jgi:hypothetical protein
MKGVSQEFVVKAKNIPLLREMPANPTIVGGLKRNFG